MAASLFRRSFARLAIAAVLAAAPACGSDPTGVSIIDTEFAESLGVDLDASIRTASGLYYRDTAVGSGTQAGVGSQVSIRYTLYDVNGQPRPNNINRDWAFTIGSGEAIPGFDEGIRGMRVGGRRQLIVPPHLAYNDNTILVFTVELLNAT